MGIDVIPARPSKITSIVLGAALLLLMNTVPYLALINAFLIFGTYISWSAIKFSAVAVLFFIMFGIAWLFWNMKEGAVAVWYYIMRHQLRFSYGEAFVLGGITGFVGGALSVLAAFLLEKWFGYIPGLESLRLLVAWASSLAPDDAATFRQMLELVTTPKEISLSDLLVSMLLNGMFYAPFSGLGGRLAVFVLKRKAKKSAVGK